jgi:hypothetical protein
VTRDGDKAAEEGTAAAKLRFVHPDEAQKAPTPDVDQVVALHQLARAQREAEANANKGLYVEAQSVLDGFSRDAQIRGHVGVSNVARGLRHRVSSKALFDSTGGYRKSMEQGLLRSAKVSSYEIGARQALDSLPLGARGTQGNSAQAAYTSAFTDGEPSGPVPLTFVTPPEPVDLSSADAAARLLVAPVVRKVASPVTITTSAGRPLEWVSPEPDKG